MKRLLRKILFGPLPVTEYSTITIEDKIREKVWLYSGDQRMDISTNHWLLCLEPAVFGVWIKGGEIDLLKAGKAGYKMLFEDAEVNPSTVAKLQLHYFDKITEPGGSLLLFKLTKATSNHINFIRTQLIFQKYYKKPEQDIFKLKSFAAAYSYPRNVRIVSIKDETHVNMFPMDLTGDISDSNRIVFGLRHTNQSLGRILQKRQLVISEVPYEYKKVIYQLGKHHRGDLSMESLPFQLIQSEKFGFPVPDWAIGYKEVQVIKTIDLGSHMLLWTEIINEQKLTENRNQLFHIHFLHYLHQYKKGLNNPMV